MSFNESRKIIEQLKKHEVKIKEATSEMGTIAQNHFVKSFYNQGFTDVMIDKWKPRKRTRYRTRSGKWVDDTNRSILVKTGDLRRSLRKIQKGTYSVWIVSDKKYANIHNEGLMGKAWGKHYFKMPKRQFVGYSRMMNGKIEKMINNKVRVVFG